jgi:hypothetical protein
MSAKVEYAFRDVVARARLAGGLKEVRVVESGGSTPLLRIVMVDEVVVGWCFRTEEEAVAMKERLQREFGRANLDETSQLFDEARKHTRTELMDGSVVCRECSRFSYGRWPCLVSRLVDWIDTSVQMGPVTAE